MGEYARGRAERLVTAVAFASIGALAVLTIA
jgi:hypothetical protein